LYHIDVPHFLETVPENSPESNIKEEDLESYEQLKKEQTSASPYIVKDFILFSGIRTGS